MQFQPQLYRNYRNSNRNSQNQHVVEPQSGFNNSFQAGSGKFPTLGKMVSSFPPFRWRSHQVDGELLAKSLLARSPFPLFPPVLLAGASPLTPAEARENGGNHCRPENPQSFFQKSRKQ
jgi:hypothetical protein